MVANRAVLMTVLMKKKVTKKKSEKILIQTKIMLE